jgi:DNA integrity scanning protein DisA with diadenylate cyclase activity
MPDTKLDREFLRSILTLAAKPAVDHLLVVMDVPLSKDDLRGRPLKKKIIYAVSEEQLAQNLRRLGYVCVTVPPYDYSRVEKVKVALVAAMTANELKDGEDVLCMTGRTGARLPDTVVRLQIGRGFEEKASIDTQGLGAEFSSQVVEALVSLAMAIGHEGFEGHPIGTIFVLGDSTAVMEKSKQLTINPFQGISEAGVVLAAGRYLQTGEGKVDLPLGLGARHAAAAAITVETKAVAISVSQSSGAVRVFKGGQAVLELQQVARRS